MILIVGANGNMGSRYKAVLDYLDKDFVEIDIGTDLDFKKKVIPRCSGILIVTPTSEHYKCITEYAQYGKPILCEKPITTKLHELDDILATVDRYKCDFKMVYQYKQFLCGNRRALSYYDYFKHGNDGLYWDCLQIIGLAKGKIKLGEQSPIWKCQINGKKLDLNQMDMAYIKMIEEWMDDPSMPLNEIRDIHQKVEELRMKNINGRI